MRHAYLLSFVTDEDVSSVLFIFKETAETHIAKRYPEYKKTAEDEKEDVTYWRGPGGDGLLLEKLKVEE